MDHARNVATAREAGSALLAAAREAPDATVPTCPEWTLTDLAAHVGRVLTWWGAQAAGGPEGGPVDPRALPGPPDHGLFDWVDDLLRRTLDVVAAMDTDATWGTFLGPRPGTFHARRLAQELTVHRYDALTGTAAAAGRPPPAPTSLIDADLGVDGVDELLDEFAPRLGTATLTRTSRLHLHATDAGLADGTGEWTVDLVPGAPVHVERGHAKGDLAVRGPAAGLLLLLWNRVPLEDGFEVFGDTGVAADWAATFRI